MAGDWFAIRTCITRIREVVAIAATTGRDRHQVVGLMVDLWGWVNEESADGSIPSVTPDSLVAVIGADLEFWGAVSAAGWLDVTAEGLRIPNFERWNGASAKKRLQAQRRKQNSRGEYAPAEQDDAVTPRSRPGHADVTEVSRLERDKSVNREEKRREDSRDESLENPSCPEPAETGRPGPPAGPALWGKPPVQFDPDSHRWQGITDRHRSTWSEGCPAVDLDRELAKAAAWVISNPAKGRKSNYLRFLTRWLQSAQDNAGRVQTGRGDPRATSAETIAQKLARIREQQAREGPCLTDATSTTPTIGTAGGP
jgi:hypothetical protein